MADLLSLAGPAATIIAAGAAVFVTWRLGKSQLNISEEQKAIAYQQMKLAADRLQLDRYDRRFRIYNEARRFIIEDILRNGRVSDHALMEFIGGTGDSIFLLDAQVTNYLMKIRKRAIRLRFLGKAIPGTSPMDDNRGKYIDEEAKLLNWFSQQQDVLREKFKPFLTLERP
ncbi:MAG: hypothetical protein JO267_06325 [Alphaproteobacteria bacterium]|nr:hypothetical protein [Alphaproteobacteria bacterium]MBV9861748.1 hypothetical protein [Alphaproteobacteria bacterium]